MESEVQLVVVGKRFSVRAVAYIIDVVALYGSNYVAGSIGGVALGIMLAFSGREFSVDEQSLQCLDILSGLFLSVLYFTVFEWLYGAIPGKLILGMRVVKDNGEPCDIRAAFTRALLRFIDGLFFGIPAYASMKHPLYQRIGDKTAKTLVVSYKESMIRQARAWWWFLVAGGLYLTLASITVALLVSFALR